MLISARYDKHLEKGFPTWRGTGYYYAKFQPGLMFTFVFILTTISTAQYVIKWVFYFRELNEMAALKEEDEIYAREQREKKEKKAKKNKKKNIQEEEEEEEIVYDYSVDKPAIVDLVIFAFPIMIFRSITGIFSKSSNQKVKAE